MKQEVQSIKYRVSSLKTQDITCLPSVAIGLPPMIPRDRILTDLSQYFGKPETHAKPF